MDPSDFRGTEPLYGKDLEAERDRRRREDVVYLTHPMREPDICEPHITPAQLQANEARLMGMGFACTIEGRVKRFTYETPTHIVFGDPLPIINNTLDLRVFKKLASKRFRTIASAWISAETSWKNDSKDEFLSRLAAIALKDKRPKRKG